MSRREAFFAGVIFTESGEPAKATHIGDEPAYAIPDGDFLRHIDAIEVDRQVMAQLKEQIMAIKDIVIDSVMQMMESDDPFTRAALEQNLENMDQILDIGADVPNLEDLRLGLWMTGFRVTVDFHVRW